MVKSEQGFQINDPGVSRCNPGESQINLTCLSIQLLGSYRVTLNSEPVDVFESDKVRALLAYLAVEADRPHGSGRLRSLDDHPMAVGYSLS